MNRLLVLGPHARLVYDEEESLYYVEYTHSKDKLGEPIWLLERTLAPTAPLHYILKQLQKRTEDWETKFWKQYASNTCATCNAELEKDEE